MIKGLLRAPRGRCKTHTRPRGIREIFPKFLLQSVYGVPLCPYSFHHRDILLPIYSFTRLTGVGVGDKNLVRKIRARAHNKNDKYPSAGLHIILRGSTHNKGAFRNLTRLAGVRRVNEFGIYDDAPRANK